MRFSPWLATLVWMAGASAAFAHAQDSTTQAWPYSMEVVDEYGQRLPTFHQNGRDYVLGHKGQRYLIRVTNQSARRVEVVTSVDGRDVLDGRSAGVGKRGYIVGPYSNVLIDGFRLDGSSVAAFRFSSVPRSYAAQMGNARDVGVIGAAIFPEREYIVPPPLAVPPMGSRRDSRGLSSESKAGAPAQRSAPSASMDESVRSREEGDHSKLAQRPGLGTEFGEAHTSHVRTVEFRRASAHPATVLTARYNNRVGLMALGIQVDGPIAYGNDPWLRETAEPFRNNGYARPPPNWRGW
ncbi:MAG: hypothetical protein ACKVPX_16570 [Myxococcaceae bacterium]